MTKGIMTFDNWVKDILKIEPSRITALSPENQKCIKFTVSVDDLIKLWNGGVENGLYGSQKKEKLNDN